MDHDLPVAKPFAFTQTLAFLGSFPPCRNDYVLGDDSLTAAIALDGVAHAFTLTGRGGRLRFTGDRRLAARACDFVGAGDDLTAFYAAAADDPDFAPLVRALHGLHHVRFLTLEEIAVYAVMMQRTPVTVASRYKQRFLEHFGIPVTVGDRILRAMPEMSALVGLDGAQIDRAIGHAGKGERIAGVVQGVAALGEAFLRTAPYDEARAALVAIPGIGPFSATAILLRGLGRMDALPGPGFAADEAREVYGPRFDEPAIRARYGAQIGYWSFYLKVSAGASRRRSRESIRSAS